MKQAFFSASKASRRLGLVLAASMVTSYVGAVGLAAAAGINHPEGDHLAPTGRGTGEHDPSGEVARNAQTFAITPSNGILYHGGPIMPGAVNIYYIWYGAWNTPGDTTQPLLTNLGQHIGGTPYFAINMTYFDSTGATVSGAVNFAGATHDPGSQGSALTDAGVKQVVATALANHSLPTDANGVYFVLTSKEVKETSGFCTQYCGWHTRGTINQRSIKYSFVGNPAQQCPSACSAQAKSPNNNLGADAMASVIAHELAESVSDPNLNAWFDQSGNENADKCAWTFGATTLMPGGARYNITWTDKATLAQTHWLLQQNWLNANGGRCTLAN